MGWSVDNIYNLMKYLTNKNQSGGISSTDLFYAWNSEQASTQSDLLGRWQAQNNGKTGMNTGLIEDETIVLKLAPFTIPFTLNISGGFADAPDDFIYAIALRINGQKVYHFNKDERWAIEENVIDPPSITDDSYYYTEYAKTDPNTGTRFLFLPTSVSSAELDYIAAARDIYWGFGLDADNRQVYDPNLSVQPKWDNNTIIEITKRTLKSLGVHFSDQDFEAFGNSVINTGD